MLARIISEKRRKEPNCAEYCAPFGNIVPNCAEKFAEYCVEMCRKVPKIPKSKIGQNTILGIHSRFPAFSLSSPLSRFLALF
jgi:hypothetical protein